MGTLKNRKHENFVQNLVTKKLSPRDAYRMTYPDANPEPGSAPSNLLSRPDVKNRLLELMHLVYTPDAFKKKFAELVNAQKPVIYNGEITGYYADNASQLETLKLYLKSANVIGNESNAGNVTTFNNQFNVAVIDSQEALNIAKEIKSLSVQIKKNPVGKKIVSEK